MISQTGLIVCIFSAALRLVRKVVGLKDEFYYRYIIKGDLIGPIVEAFVANGDKYNLLNSAMIELFEFIKFVSIQKLSICLSVVYFLEWNYFLCMLHNINLSI